MNQHLTKLSTRFGFLVFGMVLLASFLLPQLMTTNVAHAAPCVLGQLPTTEIPCELEACDPDEGAGTENGCKCDPSLPSCESGNIACAGSDCGLIRRYLNPLINFLTAIVGIVATIAIIVGGIQYTTSADDPQKVSAAKSRILNAIIALIAFIFLWAFLQWLVPGGVFNS